MLRANRLSDIKQQLDGEGTHLERSLYTCVPPAFEDVPQWRNCRKPQSHLHDAISETKAMFWSVTRQWHKKLLAWQPHPLTWLPNNLKCSHQCYGEAKGTSRTNLHFFCPKLKFYSIRWTIKPQWQRVKWTGSLTQLDWFGTSKQSRNAANRHVGLWFLLPKSMKGALKMPKLKLKWWDASTSVSTDPLSSTQSNTVNWNSS